MLNINFFKTTFLACFMTLLFSGCGNQEIYKFENGYKYGSETTLCFLNELVFTNNKKDDFSFSPDENAIFYHPHNHIPISDRLNDSSYYNEAIRNCIFVNTGITTKLKTEQIQDVCDRSLVFSNKNCLVDYNSHIWISEKNAKKISKENLTKTFSDEEEKLQEYSRFQNSNLNSYQQSGDKKELNK